MASFTKFHKLVLSIGAVSGAAIYYITNYYEPERKELSKNKAHASWTTNYVPSVKWDENWDHRHPASLIKPNNKDKGDISEISNKFEIAKSQATRHVILIRHGQYNLEGVTDEDRYLTNLGVQQAEATGIRLHELSLPYTDMVRSTMTRAQQTGELISKSLPDIPVRNCDLIREGAPIPPEPPVGHWKPEPHDGARIEAAFREYFYRANPEQKKDTYTILVCHANVIRYFVCRALQFPPEAWLRLSLNHGSITWLSITPSGRVILRNLGDTGHMPANLITSR